MNVTDRGRLERVNAWSYYRPYSIQKSPDNPNKFREKNEFLLNFEVRIKTAMNPSHEISLYIFFKCRKQQFRKPSPSKIEFRRRIGLILPELVAIYSEFALPFMAKKIWEDEFHSWLTSAVIEGLMETDNLPVYVIVAKLAHEMSIPMSTNDRHGLLSTIFQNKEHPGVTGMIRDRIASLSPGNTHEYVMQGMIRLLHSITMVWE